MNITNEEISNYVSDVILQNKPYIDQHIFDGTTDSQSLAEITSRMILNAVQISSHISVTATIILLSRLNLIDLDIPEQSSHENTSSSHLRLVWDSSHPDTTE